MTSAIASRIASRPTSSSGLLSRPSRAAVGNLFSYMHLRQTYYLYCTLIYSVHYCHTNLRKMLTLTWSLTLTLFLAVTVSENRNFNIQHKIVLNYMWNCWKRMQSVMMRLSMWILARIAFVGIASVRIESAFCLLQKWKESLLYGHSNKPHYDSCPSICLSVSCRLLPRNQKCVEKPKMVCACSPPRQSSLVQLSAQKIRQMAA